MAKTFPVKLEVEEIALGTVLRKLHDMPGVVKLDLDFGEGGKGAGREKLQRAAVERSASPEEMIMAALSHGKPMKSADLIKATGMKPHRVYYALGKIGIKRNAEGFYHILPISELASLKALPAPAIKRGPTGRASPGSGNVVLIGVLKSEQAAMPTSKLRTFLGNNGMSAKSVSGVLNRAKRDGIIKATKEGYVFSEG